MGLEKTLMFQILRDGKVKVLTEHEYLRRMHRVGWVCGWVNKKYILFTERPGTVKWETIQELYDLYYEKFGGTDE